MQQGVPGTEREHGEDCEECLGAKILDAARVS